MNKYKLLQTAHWAYNHFVSSHVPNKAESLVEDPDEAARLITETLSSGKPCMIARLGSVELDVTASYKCRTSMQHNAWKYIKGDIPTWWWTEQQIINLKRNAGVFNPTKEVIEHFAQMTIKDMRLVDILGSWQSSEQLFDEELKNAAKVRLRYLEPFWSKKPWTACLKDKRVLVIHPFADTIRGQYGKRHLLFKQPDILPTFKSFEIIKAVQSIGDNCDGFATWFDALHSMEDAMDKTDYDVALIGCGAYGFPLAAHAKETGKQAVHMGGALQLLFGIKGKRWFNPVDKNLFDTYSHLANDHWTYPKAAEKPAKANEVEDGCYW